MGIRSKGALALLALALSCSPALPQDGAQGPPPDQQGARDGFGPRGPMRREGPDEEGGRWGQREGGFARRGPMGRRGFGGGSREFGLARLLADPAVRQQLGITAEQAATIRQQESDFRKTEIRGRADLEVKRIDLKDLLEADKPDRAAIDSKLGEISVAQLALQKSAIGFRLTMRDAISPAQREKLRQWMSDRRRGGGPPRANPAGAARRGGRGSAPAAPSPQGHPQDGAPPNN